MTSLLALNLSRELGINVSSAEGPGPEISFFWTPEINRETVNCHLNNFAQDGARIEFSDETPVCLMCLLTSPLIDDDDI